MGLIILPEDDINPQPASQEGHQSSVVAMPSPGLFLPERGGVVVDDAGRAGFRHVEMDASSGGAADPAVLAGLAAGELRKRLREAELSLDVLRWQGPVATSENRLRRDGVAWLRGAIETAHHLGVRDVIVRGLTREPRGESWRYLLDSLYDVAGDAVNAGVRLNLEPGNEQENALRLPESCRCCLQQAPEATGLGVSQQYAALLGAEAMEDLAGRVRHYRMDARQVERDWILADADASMRVARRLVSHAYGGQLCVVPQGDEYPQREELASLYTALAGYLPSLMG